MGSREVLSGFWKSSEWVLGKFGMGSREVLSGF